MDKVFVVFEILDNQIINVYLYKRELMAKQKKINLYYANFDKDRNRYNVIIKEYEVK